MSKDDKIKQQTYTAFSGCEFDPAVIVAIKFTVRRESMPVFNGIESTYIRANRSITGEIISDPVNFYGDCDSDEGLNIGDITLSFYSTYGSVGHKTLYGITLTGWKDEIYSFKARQIGPMIPHLGIMDA